MNKKKITIGGWYNPSLDDETIKKIKDCGIDCIFLEGDNIGNNCLDEVLIDKNLELCDKYGLKAYVQKGNDVDIKTAIVRDEKFSDHESFLGLLMYDEPPAELFDSLHEEVKIYHEERIASEPFINLLPSYARSDRILGNYNVYINGFCNKFLNCNLNIKYLSFDFYPLIYGQDENPCLADRWLNDVYIVAQNAKKHGAAANAFIQAMPFSKNGKKYGSRDRIPTYEDLSLQFYIYLAFGYTSLTYFCLGTPSENAEFSSADYALLGKNNEETPTYFHAKRIDEEVKKLSEILADYQWEDVKRLGQDELFDFAKDIKEFFDTEELKIKTNGKLVIGEFIKNEQEKAIMLVNFGETTETFITEQTLTFGKETSVSVYRGGEKKSVRTDTLSLLLHAGEGIFITYEVL